MAETTLTQYKARINAKLGLDSGDSSLMTILTDYLNEGYEDVLYRTRCYTRAANIDFTADEAEYTLPTQALQILGWRDSATGSDRVMQRLTLAEIRQMQIAQGSPPVRFYASEGDRIVVYPTPGDGESVLLDYIPRPTPLSGASDKPTLIPSEFHKTLEYYGLREMSEYAERGTTEGSGKWAALYENECARLRRHGMTRGGRSLAPARPGRVQRTVPSDPARTSY